MYTISKEFDFSAAHWIEGLPEGHKCARLHGHNYKIRVTLQAVTLQGPGFVRDYAEMDVIKKFLDETFDHRSMNEVLGHNQTTAENFAKFLWWRLTEMGFEDSAMVEVSETPKTWASFRLS